MLIEEPPLMTGSFDPNEYIMPSPRTLKIMFQKDGQLLNAYVKDV